MFKITKNLAFFLSLGTLSLGSSFAFAATHCDVLAQVNSKGAKNNNYRSIKTVELNDEYKPANIVIDGVSLNERLLGGLSNEPREEVMRRSEYYVKVDRDSDGILKSLSMTNDWDTYEITAQFMSADHQSADHFVGMMKIHWDDQYTLMLDCHR